MQKDPNQLSYREYPTPLFLFALFSIVAGIYIYFQNGKWTTLAIAFAIALLILLTVSVLEVSANRITRTLSISRRGPIQRYHKEIPFSEINAIQVRGSTDSDGGGRAYRVEIRLKDGNIIPLRETYYGGKGGKEKQARKLRDFIGVGGVDISGGIFGAIRQMKNQQFQPQLRAEQESITGYQDQIHETKGVRWQLQTFAFGSSPVSRWRTTDYALPGNFLYLTQKVRGQEAFPGKKFLQTIYDKLFEQSLKIYAFESTDTPNRKNAAPYPLGDRLSEYFVAYTSNPQIATQILTPWTTLPLANWAQNHPLTNGSTDQLVVLFSPNGLYLAIMGYLNAEYLNELAALGAELVLAQQR